MTTTIDRREHSSTQHTDETNGHKPFLKDKTLHMIGNAHLDPVWLWRWQEGFQAAKATFRSALDRMSESDDFVFTSSSAAVYEWIEQNDPRMFEEIVRRVAEGRWQLVGGWWIQPDCNLPCGESFVRQGLYGQRYFREKFGVTANVGYNVDSFGHHAMLPQILKKSGMDYYVFMRPEPHEKGLPGRLFWWESDDGARVLTFRIPYEYCTWGKDLEKHVRRCVGELKAPFDELMCFYGVGNHGGGPTRENLASIGRMQEDPAFPTLSFSAPSQFFQAVRARDLPFPVVHDELQHHASGCYAAHSGIKRWNRQAENLLISAEKFAIIAERVTGQPYPDFSRAWKNVLFNQFHDILAGTSVEAAYEDARDLHGEAMAIAARGLNYAVQSLAWNIAIAPEPEMQPIVVFNPHAWSARMYVEVELNGLKDGYELVDDAGRQVPAQIERPAAIVSGWRRRLGFVAELPALGYRVYRLRPVSEETRRQGDKETRPAPSGNEGRQGDKETRSQESGVRSQESGVRSQESESSTPNTQHPTPNTQHPTPDTRHPSPIPHPPSPGEALENERFRLTIDPATGYIASLYDKRHQQEVFLGQAARPVLIDDPSDTWGHGVYQFHHEIGAFTARRVKHSADGPVKSTLLVESTYGASRLIQEFTLYRDLEQIDVQVTVDWREQFKMLKLAFPVNLNFLRATYEIPYGHIERPTNGEEEPGQSWIDLSGIARGGDVAYGLSVLNDGKHSFDISGRTISMTVLRSPIYAHHNPTVPQPDEPYSFTDQGIQRFSYTLLPHAGGWEQAGTVRRAAELNQRPIALVETYHEGFLPQRESYLSVEPHNIVVSALKQAEDNDDMVIRCYETNKVATQATIRLPHWNREIVTAFGPCEIKTFRIPKDERLPVVETDLIERAD